jgi:hypothetical protein
MEHSSIELVEPIRRNFEMCRQAILQSVMNFRFVIPIITEDQLRSYEVLRFHHNPETDEYDEPYLENTVSISKYQEFANLDNYPELTPFNKISEEEYDIIVHNNVFLGIPYQKLMSPAKYISLCEKACRENHRFKPHHFRAIKKEDVPKENRCFSIMSRQEYLYLCRLAKLPQYINHKALQRNDWM